MKHVLKIALITAAFVLPQVSSAQNAGRFPTIPPEKYTAQQKKFVEELSKPPRNSNLTNGPFKVYFRSPEFGLLAIDMSDYLRWGTGMEPRIVEFVTLIAARNWSSNYVWHAHYPAAIKGGLDPSVAADMAAGKRPAKMKADEAIIYDFLTEMYRDKTVSDASYNAMLAKYGEKGIMDIVGLAGYYGITAMVLITSKQATDPGDEPKLQAVAQIFPK